MRTIIMLTLILGLCLGLTQKADSETYVTTYITKVQEERQSTRWTLTEWLHIKERMKLMDVWLAMFSDPQKDEFRPELSFGGGLLSTNLKRSDSDSSQDYQSKYATAQLWMTNLVSATVGIRTLNIDWGFEGMMRTGQSNFFSNSALASPASTTLNMSSGLSVLSDDASDRQTRNQYTANLRIFGKNIQDSSLNLKYGRYNYRTAWAFPDAQLADKSRHYHGLMYGADLQLYLLKWLGAEGSYQVYDQSQVSNLKLSGRQFNYGPYIEISLFRFIGGLYQEDWRLRDTEIDAATGQTRKQDLRETGYYYGLKIQL